MATFPLRGHRVSGTHGEGTINAAHMAVWAIVLAIITVPTVPLAFGYFFGSLSVVFASVVIARHSRDQAGPGPVVGAWIAMVVSLFAMFGYIVYILTESPNYWG